MKKYSTYGVFIVFWLFTGLAYAHPHEITELTREAQLGFAIIIGACSIFLTVWLAKGRKQNLKRNSLERKQDNFEQE